MAAIIFEKSAEITQRLIGLIEDADTGIDIYHTNLYSDVISLLYQKPVRVAILDLNYGKEISLQLIDLIKQIDPRILVIMMYTCFDEEKIKACHTHGACFMFDKYNDFGKITTLIGFLS